LRQLGRHWHRTRPDKEGRNMNLGSGRRRVN
jgi:hypothetical protein